MLYVFGGLPGVGKTTLARRLAREVGAVYVRIDTIEQALREAGVGPVTVEGYVVGYRVAGENLRLGRSVVADCVNPVEVTRAAWREVAEGAGVACVEIEAVCADALEHRRRVESRANDIAGHRVPSWEEVCVREYEAWRHGRVVIDTAGKAEGESFGELMRMIGRGGCGGT